MVYKSVLATLAFLFMTSAGLTTAAADAPKAYFPAEFAESSVVCSENGRSWNKPRLDEFSHRWYSEYLDALGEPVLYTTVGDRQKSGSSVVRFTWLRSFHTPVVVRVELRRSGDIELIAAELAEDKRTDEGSEPGDIARSKKRILRHGEKADLRAALAKTSLPTLPHDACNEAGMDGSQWIFESVDESGYHFVERWSPDDGQVRELGLVFLRLTGWRWPRKEVY